MSKNKVLVVGGAGYIDSHMVKYLTSRDFAPVVFDNLSTGHAESARYGQLVVADAKAATEMLNWQPEYKGLEVMVEHAWAWELRQR